MQLKSCLIFKLVFLLYHIKFTSLETEQVECGDENCSVSLGKGVAQTHIASVLDGYLKLKAGEEVTILGVVGKDKFWVETSKKERGFVKAGPNFRELSSIKRKHLKKSNITSKKLLNRNIDKESTTLPLNENDPDEVNGLKKNPATDKPKTLEQVEDASKENSKSTLSVNKENLDDEDITKNENDTGKIEKDEIEETGEEVNEYNTGSSESDIQTEDNENRNIEKHIESENDQMAETPKTEKNLDQANTEELEESIAPDNRKESLSSTINENNNNSLAAPDELEVITPNPLDIEVPTPPNADNVNPVEITTATPPDKASDESESVQEEPTTIDDNQKGNISEFKPLPKANLTVTLNNTNITTDDSATTEVYQKSEHGQNLMNVSGTSIKLPTPPPMLGLIKAQPSLTNPIKQTSKIQDSLDANDSLTIVETHSKSDVKDSNSIDIEQSNENNDVNTQKSVSETLQNGDGDGDKRLNPATLKNFTEDSVDSKFESKANAELNINVQSSKSTDDLNEENTMKPERQSNTKPEEIDQSNEKAMLDNESEKFEQTETEQEPQPNQQIAPEDQHKSEPVTELSQKTSNDEQTINNTNQAETKKELIKETEPENAEYLLSKEKLESLETPSTSEQKESQLENLQNKHDTTISTLGKNNPLMPTDSKLELSSKETETSAKFKKNQIHPKLDEMKSLLETEVPNPGLEVDSAELMDSKATQKEGIPSVIEITRNEKLSTRNEQDSVLSDDDYCEKVGPNLCPKKYQQQIQQQDNTHKEGDFTSFSGSPFGLDVVVNNEYFMLFVEKSLEMIDLIIYLTITASAIIFFLLLHSCIKRCMRESPLIEKINHLERSLMTSIKENAVLKGEMTDTKTKLLQIENSSFGSNEMVVALKQELTESEETRYQLQEQISILETELQKSAEAGTELNKMLSDLLNSQTGSESILQSVEQLQKQLDEQQLTIESMNEALSTKSRENSELQVRLSEITSKLNQELKSLKGSYDDIELEKICIENELKNLKKTFDVKIDMIEKTKLDEIERIKQRLAKKEKEMHDLHQKYRANEAKIQALNECIGEMKKGADVTDYLDSIDVKADLILLTKERDTLKEQLDSEKDIKQSLEEQVNLIREEMEKIKKEFGIAEKAKVEAETRLDVLSTYFRQKESELQRELSIKEALWMQQQGETTSTVERVKAMKEEIQQLKSQNESLKAEILTQDSAHKTQIVSLESKVHEAWLNARQSERKVEELKQESTMLRRRLTTMAELQPSSANNSLNHSTNAVDGSQPMPSLNDLNTVPSPLRVESPNSPLMMHPIPPPPFLPPHLMGPPGPIPSGLPGIPPPPFIPPPIGQAPVEFSRPMGRLVSPPPNRYSPSIVDSRYSPDSRYHDDYSVMSRYDTETDFSPPPSPPPSKRNPYYRDGPNGGGSHKIYSPTSLPQNGRNRKINKGGFNSSGSQDSIIGSGSRRDGKI